MGCLGGGACDRDARLGWLWSAGANGTIAGYSLLGWHDALGAVLAVLVVVHMVLRAKPLRARDAVHRRQFLAATGIGVGSLLAWRSQRPLLALLQLRGANRRFTGSYEAGSFAGNAFPTTSWVADSPRPIALDSYRLRVTGLVATELELALADLPPRDELVATLDCTGGFYSTQRWRGTLLSRILEQAPPDHNRARARERRVPHRLSVELCAGGRVAAAARHARRRRSVESRARGSPAAGGAGIEGISVGQVGAANRGARPPRLRSARVDAVEQLHARRSG